MHYKARKKALHKLLLWETLLSMNIHIDIFKSTCRSIMIIIKAKKQRNWQCKDRETIKNRRIFAFFFGHVLKGKKECIAQVTALRDIISMNIYIDIFKSTCRSIMIVIKAKKQRNWQCKERETIKNRRILLFSLPCTIRQERMHCASYSFQKNWLSMNIHKDIFKSTCRSIML